MKTFIFAFFFLIVLCCNAQEVPERMQFAGMDLHIHRDARNEIQRQVDKLTTPSSYFDKLVDRMNLYFPVIERVFSEKNIPKEIKFLAIQESGLVSDAVSSSNAVGFWQFKDFTAREVGLVVNRNIDERKNIVAATKGAANYLHTNNEYFDNWIYAVMAYNTGRRGADKYVQESHIGKKEMVINKKTHWYVIKFLAHTIAFYPYIGKPMTTEDIWLYEDTDTRGKSLKQIAARHDLELDRLKEYNKWLRSNVPNDDFTYTVLVPKTGKSPYVSTGNYFSSGQRVISSVGEKAKNSNDNASFYPASVDNTLPDENLPRELKKGIQKPVTKVVFKRNGIKSTFVEKEDKISFLATVGGITEKKFRKINDLKIKDDLKPFTFYYFQNKKRSSKVSYHVVVEGEKLWDISQYYGIKLKKLAGKNRISADEKLVEGTVIWLNKSLPKDMQTERIAVNSKYKIRPVYEAFDSPRKATQKYVKKRENEDLSRDNVYKTPQKFERKNTKKVMIHTVRKNETPYAIAKQYNISVDDLMKWNKLSPKEIVSVGDNLRVKPFMQELAKEKEVLEYRINRGDTLYSISRKFKMTVDELKELNKMRSSSLEIGDKLKVFQ